MEVITISPSRWESNSYLLVSNRRAVLVDAGADVKTVLQKTAELNKTLDKYDTDKKGYWIEFLEACGQFFDLINH